MNTVELNSINLQSIDVASNNVSSIGKSIKKNNKPYIKGHISTSDNMFTFSINNTDVTVNVDSNGNFKYKPISTITSLSFVGVPQLESLELFKIDGVTSFDVDYPTAINYIKCDSTTKNAKNDVYHIRGTATEDFTFNVQYNTGGQVIETANIDSNGKWDISYSGKKLYSLDSSFKNNTAITSLCVTEDCSLLINLDSVCNGASNLLSVEINSNLPNVKIANNCFANCSSLQSINTGKWELPSLTMIYNGFSNCGSLTSLDLGKMTFANVTNCGGMFVSCSNLSAVAFKQGIKFDKATAIMAFNGCQKLKSINLEDATFEKATSCSYMFMNCKELEEVLLPKATFESVTDLSGIFNNAQKVTTIDLSSATFGVASSMSNQFAYNANVLTSLNVPNLSSFGLTISFAWNPLTYESMLKVANWLKDLSGESAQTVTFRKATYDALTAEQKAELEGIIVTQKGWNLATA